MSFTESAHSENRAEGTGPAALAPVASNTRSLPLPTRIAFIEGSKKARFDQQPVEACATVSDCLEVYRLTEESQWLEEARRAFSWFLGKNDLQAPLYDAVTGGCRDGLHPDRVNENEGAESTLSFLMALLEMQALNVANVDQLHQETSAAFESDHLAG